MILKTFPTCFLALFFSLTEVAAGCWGFAKHGGRRPRRFGASHWTTGTRGCKFGQTRTPASVLGCPAAGTGDIKEKREAEGDQICSCCQFLKAKTTVADKPDAKQRSSTQISRNANRYVSRNQVDRKFCLQEPFYFRCFWKQNGSCFFFCAVCFAYEIKVFWVSFFLLCL